jgi:hypothetical protein
MTCRHGGHEQLISNSGRFKPAFAKRDKKHTMTDLPGISTNWFKNQFFCPFIGFLDCGISTMNSTARLKFLNGSKEGRPKLEKSLTFKNSGLLC